MTDGIIFDLDGTLWDSTEPCAEAWMETMHRLGYPDFKTSGAHMKKLFGLPLRDIGKAVLPPELTEEEFTRLLEICCVEQNPYLAGHPGTLYENVEDTLRALSEKYPLFIVSNCQKGYIEMFLETMGFEKYFKDMENPGRTGLSKAGNIKLIIERNNLSAPVYVGDTIGDCRSTREAGIPFVYAAYGFGDVEDYDYRLEDISDLKELFL